MEAKKIEKNIVRPPIVVILGHIDHGKTTLLDKIRQTQVADSETGGITQHVGAYEVDFEGKKITFIDTPGHEAFSAMRARGAKVADIAILVVAGDDGVKVQTKEAIDYIKKAKIPMIAVINKVDKPQADPEKVKRELSEEKIIVEDLGGEIPSVLVSAKTGKGIKELLELILLVAEMQDLKGDLSKTARGVVIESFLDSFRGPTATLLIRDGILKVGDIVATASTFGKIKILENFLREQIKEALPSMPVILLGLTKAPQVGEKFQVSVSLEEAEQYAQSQKELKVQEKPVIESDRNTLNLILKTDVLGSIEAIEKVLEVIPQEKIKINIIRAKAGRITESDIQLAKTAKAKILGFRIKTDSTAKNLAEREKVQIVIFNIIYDLAQGVRELMEKKLKPEVVREDLGKMKVLVIFKTQKKRQIIGGKIIDGEVRKNGISIEVFRGEEKVGEGRLISLQINKKDVEKASRGDECGILYEGDIKVQQNDTLLFYTKEKKKVEL